MKTEQEIKDLLTETKPELANAVNELAKAIANSDWENAVEWCTAIHTGICVVNVAEGILQ